MTTLVNRHIRAQPSSFIQWLALTKRTVRMMRVKGEFIIAVLAPLIFTIGFYLPLKYVMQVQGIDYAQFVMAIIVLQAMSFTMTSTPFVCSPSGTFACTTTLVVLTGTLTVTPPE